MKSENNLIERQNIARRGTKFQYRGRDSRQYNQVWRMEDLIQELDCIQKGKKIKKISV